MQMTLFFFCFFYGCYYSSPSVKRASHTLVGPLVLRCRIPTAPMPNYFCLLIPLSRAESACLFFSTCSHSSLVKRCHSPPGHQMSSDAPAHLGSPVPVCSHTCISLCRSAFTACSAPSNLCLLHLHLALLDVLDVFQRASHKSSPYLTRGPG